jgi:putative endonuclease
VPDRRRALGTDGEAIVARWYEASGYVVLDRNWRCREGELDLVVARGRDIVFCEVKTRRSLAFGAPVEAVTRVKQRRLRVLAARWLGAHPNARERDPRFDVASVLARGDGPPDVEVLEAAF